MRKIRIERLLVARLLLVQDDLINYRAGGVHRYANLEDKSLLPVLKDAIIKNIAVDLMIERVPEGGKSVDYVREATLSVSEEIWQALWREVRKRGTATTCGIKINCER